MYKAPPVRYIHLYYIIIELRSDSAPVWRHTASQRDFIGVDMTELGTQLYVYGDKIPTLKSAYFWLSNRRREWNRIHTRRKKKKTGIWKEKDGNNDFGKTRYL